MSAHVQPWHRQAAKEAFSAYCDYSSRQSNVDTLASVIARHDPAASDLALLRQAEQALAASQFGFADESDGKLICNCCEVSMGRPHKPDCVSENALALLRARLAKEGT